MTLTRRDIQRKIVEQSPYKQEAYRAVWGLVSLLTDFDGPQQAYRFRY